MLMSPNDIFKNCLDLNDLFPWSSGKVEAFSMVAKGTAMRQSSDVQFLFSPIIQLTLKGLVSMSAELTLTRLSQPMCPGQWERIQSPASTPARLHLTLSLTQLFSPKLERSLSLDHEQALPRSIAADSGEHAYASKTP